MKANIRGKVMETRVENWCGYDIRFIEKNGEWWAILKDICDALKLRSKDVSQRLDPSMLERVLIGESDSTSFETTLNNRKRGECKTHWMLAVNEIGIYEALFASRRLEARKFRRWSAEVMKKLRTKVGLKGYEVMQMTDPNIQSQIDYILDSIYYDEETGRIMQSVTVQGGDVEQVPFE